MLAHTFVYSLSPSLLYGGAKIHLVPSVGPGLLSSKSWESSGAVRNVRMKIGVEMPQSVDIVVEINFHISFKSVTPPRGEGAEGEGNE